MLLMITLLLQLCTVQSIFRNAWTYVNKLPVFDENKSTGLNLENSKRHVDKIQVIRHNNLPPQLPWQMDVLVRALKLGRDMIKPTVPVVKKDQWIVALYKKIRIAFFVWAAAHKATFIVVGKASAVAAFTWVILRKIGNWFKGMAEYELLLDKTDYDYQSYGCNLNGIGGWLLSSMNATAVSQYKCSNSTRILENVLELPCFPQKMYDYAVRTGLSINKLIVDIGTKVLTTLPFFTFHDSHSNICNITKLPFYNTKRANTYSFINMHVCTR